MLEKLCPWASSQLWDENSGELLQRAAVKLLLRLNSLGEWEIGTSVLTMLRILSLLLF